MFSNSPRVVVYADFSPDESRGETQLPLNGLILLIKIGNVGCALTIGINTIPCNGNWSFSKRISLL